VTAESECDRRYDARKKTCMSSCTYKHMAVSALEEKMTYKTAFPYMSILYENVCLLTLYKNMLLYVDLEIKIDSFMYFCVVTKHVQLLRVTKLLLNRYQLSMKGLHNKNWGEIFPANIFHIFLFTVPIIFHQQWHLPPPFGSNRQPKTIPTMLTLE
jgi:hypothetical protein